MARGIFVLTVDKSEKTLEPPLYRRRWIPLPAGITGIFYLRVALESAKICQNGFPD